MELRKFKRKALVQNKWLNLFEDKYELPNDAQVTYYHALQNDGVMSIVLMDVESVMSTYIVNQYRHPIARDIWQFPMGSFDAKTHDAEHAARTELSEECGVVVGSMKKMGDFYVNPGFTNQKVSVYISSDVTKTSVPKLEDTEFGLISKIIPVADISDMIDNGEMGDAWGITGLHYINNYLKTL